MVLDDMDNNERQERGSIGTIESKEVNSKYAAEMDAGSKVLTFKKV
jgi:hypothetical protein